MLDTGLSSRVGRSPVLILTAFAACLVSLGLPTSFGQDGAADSAPAISEPLEIAPGRPAQQVDSLIEKKPLAPTSGARSPLMLVLLVIPVATGVTLAVGYLWRRRRTGASDVCLLWTRRPSLVAPLVAMFAASLLAMIVSGSFFHPLRGIIRNAKAAEWIHEHVSNEPAFVILVGLVILIAVVIFLRALAIRVLLRIARK